LKPKPADITKMSQPDLLSLPQEILELIFDEVQHECSDLALLDRETELRNTWEYVGLFELSCTCSLLRTMLAPRLVNNLCFTSRERSAKSAMLAAQKYGHHVKHLAFLGVAKDLDEVPFRVRGRNRTRVAMTGEEEEILCKEGRELLRGTHLPNAAMLDIKFDFDYYDPDSEFNILGEGMLPDFDEIETLRMMRCQEADRPWRALMNVVWQNVARNQMVRSLNFLWMPPKLCSAFHEPAFKEFMARLKSLNLLFKPTFDDWATHCELDSFVAAVGDLQTLFFEPAKALSSISCFAPVDGLFGNAIPLPFMMSRFDHLARISFIHTGLCHDLLVFLELHLNTLKHVAFLDCWSAREDEQQDWLVKWSQLFDVLQQPASKLVHFACIPTNFKTIHGPDDSERRSFLRMDPLWKDVERACGKDRTRKVFAYVTALDGWGLPTPSAQGMLTSIQKGDDQASLESLLAMAERNAKRASGDRKPHHHSTI